MNLVLWRSYSILTHKIVFKKILIKIKPRSINVFLCLQLSPEMHGTNLSQPLLLTSPSHIFWAACSQTLRHLHTVFPLLGMFPVCEFDIDGR